MKGPFIHQIERTVEAQKQGIQQVLDMVQVAVKDGNIRSVAIIYVDRKDDAYHRFMVCHEDVHHILDGAAMIAKVIQDNEAQLNEG